MTLLSVDPGVRGCGVALFSEQKLVNAAYVKNSVAESCGPKEALALAVAVATWSGPINALALEVPQTYKGRAKRGDANDLISLALVDGAIAGIFERVQIFSYFPSQWKGQVPKPKRAGEDYIIEARVRKRLSPDELERVNWPNAWKLCMDVSDAIGIGLTALSRW